MTPIFWLILIVAVCGLTITYFVGLHGYVKRLAKRIERLEGDDR